MTRQPKPEWKPAPGRRWAVAPDTAGPLAWHLATDAEVDRYHCRRSSRNPCPNRVVAWINRGYSASRYFYCADHMYGRWIEDGVVVSWKQVPA